MGRTVFFYLGYFKAIVGLALVRHVGERIHVRVCQAVVADRVLVADELSAGELVSGAEHAMSERGWVVWGFFFLDIACK